jgi:hypothetical protein
VWLICGLFEGRRSSEAALAVGAMMGLSDHPAPRTLSRWRTAYDWVERAKKFDAERETQGDAVLIESAIADDVRQANLGRVLQQLAAAGAATLAKKGATLELRGSEIATLAAQGVKIERLASGEATEIYAFMVAQYELLGNSLAPLFLRAVAAAIGQMVEAIPEADRADAIDAAEYAAGEVWGPGVNRIIREHFRTLGLTDIAIDGAPE